MSRRKAAPKRKILPDPKFGNLKVAKFMNQIMTHGKKSVAATYQIPMEVRPARRSALAMRWIATYAKSRSEKNMTLRLANELLDACEGRGEAVKKKEDTHRMAEANRAFSHFRF